MKTTKHTTGINSLKATEKKTLVANIKYIMATKYKTQSVFAKKLNVSQGTVSAWVTEDYFPSIANAQKIADVYGITFDELISTKLYKKNITKPVVGNKPNTKKPVEKKAVEKKPRSKVYAKSVIETEKAIVTMEEKGNAILVTIFNKANENKGTFEI